jgi:preprotein translocase YajC subunit
MEWLMNVIPFLQAGEPVAEAVNETAQQAPAPTGIMGLLNDFGPILFIVVMIIVMYFFVMRPQSKAQKEKDKMLKELAKGDKVESIGGIRGTVKLVKDDVIDVLVDDNTTLQFIKAAIAKRIDPSAPKAEEKK